MAAPRGQDLVGCKGGENTIINEINCDGEDTLLIRAVCENKGIDEIRELVRKNGSTNINSQNLIGYTALLYALSQGRSDVALFLLDLGASPFLCTLEEASPLHYAVASCDEAVILQLLKNGARINAQDEEGDAPLHWAVREGLELMVSLLLKRGAFVDIQNEDGETPLHLAAGLGEEGIVELLIQGGANVVLRDTEKTTPLETAVENGHEHIAKKLFSRMRSSPRGSAGLGLNRGNSGGLTPPSFSPISSPTNGYFTEKKLGLFGSGDMRLGNPSSTC